MHFGGVGVQTKCRFFAVLSTRFVDVVQQVIEDEKNLEVFAMFVWTLWYHRNELVTSNKIYPITHVIPNAQLAGTEFI